MKMTIEINCKDYLTEEEMKRIATEVFMEKCNNFLNNENDIKRIISNSSYDIVYKMVDETISEDLDAMLSNKVCEIVNSMTVFNVFKEPSVWDKAPNSMYKILERELLSRKSELGDVVIKSLQKAPKQYTRAIGQDAFTSLVASIMKRGV